MEVTLIVLQIHVMEHVYLAQILPLQTIVVDLLAQLTLHVPQEHVIMECVPIATMMFQVPCATTSCVTKILTVLPRLVLVVCAKCVPMIFLCLAIVFSVMVLPVLWIMIV